MCWDVAPGVPVLPSLPSYLRYEVALTYFEGTWKGKGLSVCTSSFWAGLVSRGQKMALMSAKYGSSSCQVFPAHLGVRTGRGRVPDHGLGA